MNLQFVDKNNKPLKAGDYISFDGSKPELLYECDMGYNIGVGLGVNASRHYVGSELYPLTEFPYELTPEGKIRMLTGEKFLIAVKRSKNMKAILMSIRPQHLINILNGKKTIELRTRFPKDFRGWVYLYCTKGKPYLTRIYGEWDLTKYGCEESPSGNVRTVNGKVVCRFWVDNVEEVIANNNYFSGMSSYKTEKAIYISKLEIFDKPKELGEFYYYKKRLIDCGMDCPPYVDEVKTQVRKAPQSWQYIYIEG